MGGKLPVGRNHQTSKQVKIVNSHWLKGFHTSFLAYMNDPSSFSEVSITSKKERDTLIGLLCDQ